MLSVFYSCSGSNGFMEIAFSGLLVLNLCGRLVNWISLWKFDKQPLSCLPENRKAVQKIYLNRKVSYNLLVYTMLHQHKNYPKWPEFQRSFLSRLNYTPHESVTFCSQTSHLKHSLLFSLCFSKIWGGNKIVYKVSLSTSCLFCRLQPTWWYFCYTILNKRYHLGHCFNLTLVRQLKAILSFLIIIKHVYVSVSIK